MQMLLWQQLFIFTFSTQFRKQVVVYVMCSFLINQASYPQKLTFVYKIQIVCNKEWLKIEAVLLINFTVSYISFTPFIFFLFLCATAFSSSPHGLLLGGMEWGGVWVVRGEEWSGSIISCSFDRALGLAVGLGMAQSLYFLLNYSKCRVPLDILFVFCVGQFL